MSQKYSDEFKSEAVALGLSSDKPYAATAKDLGVNYQTFGNWMRLAMTNQKPSKDPCITSWHCRTWLKLFYLQANIEWIWVVFGKKLIFLILFRSCAMVFWINSLIILRLMLHGSLTSPTSGLSSNGYLWLLYSTCIHVKWLVSLWDSASMRIWFVVHLKTHDDLGAID